MTTTVSSTSSASTAPVTTQGIGSGLDIASIVDKLVSVESQPLTDLQTREASYQTKLSAYGQVSSALGTFQNTVAALAAPTAFASFATSINDTTQAAVSVDSTNASALTAGSHTLQVTQLATPQRTASSGFADTTSAVGTGTITIDTGSWNAGYTAFTPNASAGSKTITIDSSNNSLAGIRDAINASGAGVTASIINDGSGNRLVIAGNSTGAANGFRISTSDGDGNNLDAAGLSQVAFDPSAAGGTPQSQHLGDASNATFVLDGLNISKPSNHVTDAISGLAIDLKAVNTTSTAFTIARDTSTAATNVSNFVSAYNTIVNGLSSLTAYNATTKTAGTLSGDTSIRLIASRLQSLVATVLPGGGSITSLNDVGVTFKDDGTLSLDSTKLSSALSSNPDAVGRLFAKTGTATDSLVSYTDSTDKTQVGTYALNVTQLASQGTLTGSAAANLTITAGVNDTIGLTIDNVATSITIPPGTYANAAALATAVQSQINGTSALSTVGSSVTVAATNGVLSFTSQRYGSASSVLVNDGNGATDLVGSSPTPTTGVDVAGTLDGTAFTGAGQVATGAAFSSTDGLKLTITGGTTGNRGTFTLSRGIAAQINDTLTQFLDPTNGLLATATTSVNSTITDLQSQEADWTSRIADIRTRITAQYNAMDTLVASLNATGTYLTQQLTALQKSTSGN
jgi:flagellar hook-associated protein 2